MLVSHLNVIKHLAMKKYIILLFILFKIGIVLANSVDIETAKEVAVNFMYDKPIISFEIKNVVTEKYNGQISYYVVNFEKGGWAMVSADNFVVPVLGYNLEGEYKLEDDKPEAFIALTTGYKEQIAHTKKIKYTNNKISSKWQTCLNDNNRNTLKSYTPGNQLLDVPGRGHIQWSQTTNNNGGCIPLYNEFCPDKGCSNPCNGKASVGCDAVATGQIMWYWQWPLSSSYRTYDWTLMPPEIFNLPTTSTNEGNEIANLLRDIGRPDAADMTYWCGGTWTTVNKIEEAFINKFKYRGVKKHVKSDWESSAWGDLLRTEIDLERPVFYRGDNPDLDELFSKHFFVIDGYDAADPDRFWLNFGHGGSSYNISRHYLNGITPANTSYDWTKNQMAVVGISPTYNVSGNINVYDVSYTNISSAKSEEARQNIALPSTGKVLTVEDDGGLTLIAGNSITLNPGFDVQEGSIFAADINPVYTADMEIRVSSWLEEFSPNGDGFEDELCFFGLENVDSYEVEVRGNGAYIYHGAGIVTGSTACIWGGEDLTVRNGTLFNVIYRFKNSYGRSYTRSIYVTITDVFGY